MTSNEKDMACSLIKRFSTYSDFHFISGVVADEARLMGSPILINESLKEYIRFEHTIPLSDLSLLNHNGRVVIADTLYSLHGNSYSKRHIDGAVVQEINLIEIDPVEDMAHFLTQIIQTNNLSKVTDIANSPDVSLKHYGIQRACDSPDNFEFSSRAYPGRSSHTDMCVWDFRYPGLRRTGAVGYTSNVPGAIVMWNSSYRTWTQGSHAEAYTVFYKYQTAGGNTELYRLNYGDLPSGQVAISKVTVTTLKSRSWGRCSSEKTRSSTSYGETYARSSIGRCNRRGTMSTHTASLTYVLGLPADYKIY